jgi:hypothetical protein
LSNNKKLDEIKEENNQNSTNKLPWQLNDLSKLELLNYLHDWNFPIFQLYEKSNNHILSKVGLNFHIFKFLIFEYFL